MLAALWKLSGFQVGCCVSGPLFKAATLPFLLLGDCCFSPVELVQRVDGVGKGGGWGQKRACSRSYASQFSQLLRSFSLEVSRGCLRRQQVAVLPKRSTNYVLGLMPLICSPLPSPFLSLCQKEKPTPGRWGVCVWEKTMTKHSKEPQTGYQLECIPPGGFELQVTIYYFQTLHC